MPKPILSGLPKSGVQSGRLFSSSQSVKVVHVIGKFWQYKSSNTDKVKATENAAITFKQGSHSLLVHQSIQSAARNAAANKNINQKITRWATPNRFVFSGYIKRYIPI